MSVEEVVSHFTKRAFAPRAWAAATVVVLGEVSVAYSDRGVSVMSEQIREAPSEAKARAVARPMPEEEPVITAILFWRRGGIVESVVVDVFEVVVRLAGDDSFGYLCLLWDKLVYCRKRKRLEVDRKKKRKKNKDK